jgi:hypothetical protein
MEAHYENVEQWLLEAMAEFLDSDQVVMLQLIDKVEDRIGREESELHIRMAKAAMVEYRNTVKSWAQE